MDSALATINAVIAALKADASVMTVVGDRVYTDVPQASVFPYVTVTIDSEPFAANDFSGQTHTVRIQCFSRKPTIAEALAARKACLDALDRNEASLSPAGFTLVRAQFRGGGMIFREDDGKTWQAIGEIEMDVV